MVIIIGDSNKIPWILFEFEKKPRGFFSRQLGLGNLHTQPSLQKIIIPETLFISCGGDYAMALTIDGIYSWGDNNYGKLGLGHRNGVSIPQKNNLLCSLITSRIIAISCGSDHTMILTEQGELFACGHNNMGQLGVGHKNNLDKFHKLKLNEFILSVNCGHRHTIVTTRSGKYYGWGDNSMGQLGLGPGERTPLWGRSSSGGDTTNRSEPTEIVIRI